MIVAEGLLRYLPEDEVPLLLQRLARHCGAGEIVFDTYSTLGLRIIALQPSVRATRAQLHWALDDPHELERQVPGLHLLAKRSTYDGADQLARMSWPAQMAIRFFSLVPPLSRLGLLLRYRF
jgi:O-methyltransferase involved in polyketide biosynthesis